VRILYIHGIGSKPSREELKQQWDLALFGRDMGAKSRMAFWADILHEPGQAYENKSTSPDSPLDIDRLLESADVDPSNAEARDLSMALLRAMGSETSHIGKEVFPLPGFLRKPIARAFLEAFVKDTAAYFFRPEVRQEVQQRFRDLLRDTEEPIVVVAHSHGSIAALEVLSEIPADAGRKVSHLITIGSPLGIREIQDFLTCERVVPPCVSAWHNFADPADMVALDKRLRGDFRTEPHQYLVDDIILNQETGLATGFNPHSAVGYLAHPRVRAVAFHATGEDEHGRFLFARDVAQSLAIDARHPVLIEILEPGFNAVGETKEDVKAYEKKVEEGVTDLASRVARATAIIREIVPEGDQKAARVDPLRRFVSARLTPAELCLIAEKHRELRIYAVWKSAAKSKLLQRSPLVIQADAAKTSYGAGGKGIVWAVLDTGAARNHPHFNSAEEQTIIEVWDCTETGTPQAIPGCEDRDGHGTHVSGIIAGSSDDGSIQGIAPLAKLIVYKVLDDYGRGEDAWIIKALDHIAVQNENSHEVKIHGVNLSLGGPYDSSVYGCGFSPICVELRRLWRSGVLVCVASGNEGEVVVSTPRGAREINNSMSIGDPANLEDCIAVGSVNADRPHLYGVSSFSSRGPTSDGRVKPDVIAPGERILSCDSRFVNDDPNSHYRMMSGTSMAAPHVSGLLAAFLSVRREFRGRPDEVKEILLRTCTDIHRDRYHQGYGIPNLMRMLLDA